MNYELKFFKNKFNSKIGCFKTLLTAYRISMY